MQGLTAPPAWATKAKRTLDAVRAAVAAAPSAHSPCTGPRTPYATCSSNSSATSAGTARPSSCARTSPSTTTGRNPKYSTCPATGLLVAGLRRVELPHRLQTLQQRRSPLQRCPGRPRQGQPVPARRRNPRPHVSRRPGPRTAAAPGPSPPQRPRPARLRQRRYARRSNTPTRWPKRNAACAAPTKPYGSSRSTTPTSSRSAAASCGRSACSPATVTRPTSSS